MESDNKNRTVEQNRKEMAKVARQILDGKIGIVIAAREINRLRLSSQTERDKDVLVFVGIDSETDHLPLGEIRKLWNAEVLKKKDEELKNYEVKVEERAFAACKNLISKYGAE